MLLLHRFSWKNKHMILKENFMHDISKVWFFVILVFLCCGCRTDGVYKGNIVEIHGAKGQWGLIVNDQPFLLKGVGVGYFSGKQVSADYLKLAKDLGANTVRTWGSNHGTEKYLNKAQEYGLYVNAGIWLNPVYDNGKGSYQTDEKYKDALAEEILAYIYKNRNHPSVLFWNIGNETIYWTKSEEERIAFAEFLEYIIQEVHRMDPHHPVIYTTAYTTAVPYIKKYVPSLDILGVNIYGGFDKMHREVVEELDIPYIVTEYGTLGAWDSTKDMNGVSVESNDEVKASYYKKYAYKIKDFYGHCLGGFSFYLGDTTQNSSTWWNLTHGPYLKYSYLVIQEIYTGKKMVRKPPIIKDVAFSKRKDLSIGEEFFVEVKMRSENEQLTYEYFATTASEVIYLEEYPNYRVPIAVKKEGATAWLRTPNESGVYRIYAVVKDGSGFASVFNKSISVK